MVIRPLEKEREREERREREKERKKTGTKTDSRESGIKHPHDGPVIVNRAINYTLA